MTIAVASGRGQQCTGGMPWPGHWRWCLGSGLWGADCAWVALLLLLLLLLQVLQLAVQTLKPNIVEVALDLIHKMIAFRCGAACCYGAV
jgi:hypothetical protein